MMFQLLDQSEGRKAPKLIIVLNNISQDGFKPQGEDDKHIDVREVIQSIRKFTMYWIERETKQCYFDFKDEDALD